MIGNAWNEMGISNNVECSGGNKFGVCWVPNSQDPNTGLRSHAGTGHYQAVVKSRKNYDLLVGHQVTRLLYNGNPENGPPRVEIESVDDKTTKVLSANLEVILAAGAVHTPQILQRSGISPPPCSEECRY